MGRKLPKVVGAGPGFIDGNADERDRGTLVQS